MSFPTIKVLGDLLPYIQDNPQFRVQEQSNGTTVVCYMLQDEDTFRGEHEEFYKECRGITFDTASGKILSRTLHKFQNVGENDNTQPDMIPWGEIVRVMDKRDGCLDSETNIITEDGVKTIKQVCDEKYFGKVLAHENGKSVFTPILAHEVKPNIGNWFKITLADNSEVILTGNHKVWSVTRNQFIRTDELTLEDEVLLR